MEATDRPASRGPQVSPESAGVAVDSTVVAPLHPPPRAAGHRLGYIVLASLPIASYFWLVARYAVNIPFWDDFDSLLGFLSKSPLDLHHFWEQHNEHRIFWTRLVAWITHRALGPVDLRILIVIGNLGVAGLGMVLAWNWETRRLPRWYFLPCLYILFAPQSWENMTWAMASLQNFYVVLFAALAIACWQWTTLRWQLAAVAWASLATFTSGNGILVFVVFFLWQFVRCYEKRAWSRVTLLWITVFAGLLLWCYFSGYQSPAAHPSIREQLLSPVRLIRFYLVLCGAFLGDLSRPIALLAGLLQVSCFLLLAGRRYDHRNPFVFYLLMFCLGSMFVASLSRAGFGVPQALASRYRILPLLTLALNYVAVSELWPQRFQQRRVFMTLLIITMVFQISFTVKASIRLCLHHDRLVSELATWQETGRGLSYPDPKIADDQLNKAIERGIYQVPAR
ncbi:MAG: hypothetical protein ACKOBW_07850 [Planctomycetota bacterium]